MSEAYRGGQEALDTIEAAEPEGEGLGLQVQLLRDRIDLLHIQVNERRVPWYRDTRFILSVLALVASFFGVGYSVVADRAEETRAERAELKEIIQRLAEMRLTNARDMATIRRKEMRRRIDHIMRQKQMMLLEAADAIVERIPDAITPAEYTTLALENGTVRQHLQEERYLARAVSGSQSPIKRVYALQMLALFYFDRLGDLAKGREVFGQSIGTLEQEIERGSDAVVRFELASTYRMWAEAELRHGQPEPARDLIALAQTHDPSLLPTAPAANEMPAGSPDGEPAPAPTLEARLP